MNTGPKMSFKDSPIIAVPCKATNIVLRIRRPRHKPLVVTL